MVWNIGQKLDTYYCQLVIDHGKGHNVGGVQSLHARATHAKSNFTTVLLIEGKDEPRALDQVAAKLYAALSQQDIIIEIDFPEHNETYENAQELTLFDTDQILYDFPCPHCNRFYYNEFDLHNHIFESHKFICHCKKSFKTEIAYEKHQETHFSFEIKSQPNSYKHSKIRGPVPRSQLKHAKEQWFKKFRQNNIKIS